MNASYWMRQFHRWIAALFTLSVIATSIAMSLAEPVMWMTYLPLLPLGLLFLTGAWLFMLPYIAKWRSRRADA